MATKPRVNSDQIRIKITASAAPMLKAIDSAADGSPTMLTGMCRISYAELGDETPCRSDGDWNQALTEPSLQSKSEAPKAFPKVYPGSVETLNSGTRFSGIKPESMRLLSDGGDSIYFSLPRFRGSNGF
jgi:hypothetical protein